MKRRKWISLLLCGALVLATLPTTALAEGTETEEEGVQVESVSEEVPVEEQTEEVVVEETLEENEAEMPEENPAETPAEAPEANSESDSEEVPAETEQESIPTEESLNLEKSVTALAANYALTTLKSPGIAVQAGTSVSYYDENGKEQTAVCNDVITQENIESYETLTTGWYAVEGTVTGNTRIKVEGTVNLILKDGCSFTVNDGIEVNEGNALTIWGQQKGNGELKAQDVGTYCAGIGGGYGKSGGNITVVGGNIIVTAYSAGAGIGGGVYGNGGMITIKGGEIEAEGGEAGAGIGGGGYGNGGTITITGGKIKAKGINGGAGIGGGRQGAGGTIKIQGGNIYASIRDGWVANGDFAIGAGMNGSGGSLSIKDSVVITRGKINEYNKDTWSGMIFENTETDGIVYGTPTLSQEFTLESTRNLLIPENTSLQGTANLTNDGNIYVSGTLAESVSGSGKVHYALTVTGGTAGGDVSTYKNQLYGKTGGLVTLNATNVPVGQAAGWSCSDNTVTIAKDAFTMPARKLTVTAQYTNAPSYTVTIPASVELGNTAKIQAEDVNVVSGSQLVVRLSNANGLKLTTPEGAEQLYTIKNGGNSIQENDAVLTVAGGTADNSGTVSLDFAPDGEPKYAGVYTGTVMFSVSVEAASNP